MLIVTVELAPGGRERGRRTLATMYIGNESDLAEVSDYRVVAEEEANPLTGEPAGTAGCMVRAHPRRQRVWALIERACGELMKTNFVETVR